MHSLHARLFGTLLGMFVCAWAVVGIYLGVQFAQVRSGSLDHGLDEIARVVLLSMPSDIGEVSSASNLRLVNSVPAGVDKLGRLAFQVWVKPRQKIVVRSVGAPATPLKPDFSDGFATVLAGGEEWRVYAISDARNEVQVQIGKPTADLTVELTWWLYYALGASLLALVVVGIALHLVVRWSLKPVVTIKSAITSREAFDLTPLPDRGLPREILPLVDSFNRLLARMR